MNDVQRLKTEVEILNEQVAFALRKLSDLEAIKAQRAEVVAPTEQEIAQDETALEAQKEEK